MDIQKRKKICFTGGGNNQKRRKQHSLEPGMVGFLCTSNSRERDCIRDAYKILNEFADEIYGQQLPNKTEAKETEEEHIDEPVDDNDGKDDEDISTALNKEISELKAVYSKPINARRFQVINTGVKNVIFVKSTLPEPLELVTKIVTELDRTKKQCTRFLLRLLPIEVICKAQMNTIKERAEPLFDKYFVKAPKTFSIIFNRHWNNNIRRGDIIEELSHMVLKKNSGNKADLKNAEIAVIVEVIRGVCLLSIAPYYYKYRKYNLVEICNTKEQPKEAKGTTEEMEDATAEVADKEETIDTQEEVTHTKEIEKQEEITDKQEETTDKQGETTDKQEEATDKEEKTTDKQEGTIDKQEKASHNDPEELKATEKEDQAEGAMEEDNESKNE